MSNFEDGSYGSAMGIALLGKVLAGRCKMKYTKAAVGRGTIPDGETPKTMLGPAEYVMDAKIVSVANPVNGECQVTIQIASDDVETGFYATNIVLYAEDPDKGDVPYTYLSLENEPEWIRPASSVVGKLATFDLIAAVGDVDAVTAIIDPEAVATVRCVEEMLQQHNASDNSHANAMDALDHEMQNLNTKVEDKVDKAAGKGLSTNDYTDEEREKLAGIRIATEGEVGEMARGLMEEAQGAGELPEGGGVRTATDTEVRGVIDSLDGIL